MNFSIPQIPQVESVTNLVTDHERNNMLGGRLTSVCNMCIILINTKYIKVSSMCSKLMHEEAPTRQLIIFSTFVIHINTNASSGIRGA